MSFFDELKRRNVFKVAVAYIVTAWLVAQVAQLAAESFGAPGWVMKMFITLLALGFPFAVIFAWAFELTPEGIKKEKEVDRSQSITPVTGQKLNYTIIALLVVALGYFAWDKFAAPAGNVNPANADTSSTGEKIISTQTPANETHAGNSIAVLPFVNMSDHKNNEYFSDGLSEELLNLLAKVPELKVAARTSSFQFKGRTGDIETIAAQLKVANVLEGSVRKAGDQVRITAQLIKADDGYHLWSETYDRKLENIFVVQDEIAAAVVAALKVKLLGAAAPVAKETDPEAYALFLKGRYLYNQASEENYAKAADAYQRAIDIDPAYAPAWAGLSQATLQRAGQGMIDLDAGVKKAREAAEHAVTLDPQLAFGWVRMSRIQGNYDWNWTAANESMQQALNLEPNASDVIWGAAALAKNLGQLDQAVNLFQKASDLDPLNQPALDALSGVLEAAGQLPEALEVERRLYALNPDYFAVHSTLGWILLRQGHAEQALAEVAQDKAEFWRMLIESLALYSLGKQAEANAALATFEEKFHRFGAYQIAEAYSWRNEPDGAFKWLNQAYEQHDPGLASLLTDTSLRNLHEDSRWPGLLEKVGLLDYWKEMPAKYKGPVH